MAFTICGSVLTGYTPEPGETCVTVPEGVCEIADGVFLGCSMTRILLPEGLRRIGMRAFYDCTMLTELRVPDSVTELGEGCFGRCTALVSLRLPELLHAVPYLMCFGCGSLRHVEIPEGVTSVGCCAFRNCRSLEGIRLPDSVTELDFDVFSGCTRLRELRFPPLVTDIPIGCCLNCTSLEEVRLPDKVERIYKEAFCGCSALRTVDFPDDLYTIGLRAFRDCPMLREVTLPSGTLTTHSTFDAGVRVWQDHGRCRSMTVQEDEITEEIRSADYREAADPLPLIEHRRKMLAMCYDERDPDKLELFGKHAVRVGLDAVRKGDVWMTELILGTGLLDEQAIDILIDAAIEYTQKGGDPECQAVLTRYKFKELSRNTDPASRLLL